jgi:broad specificity phosphatase PhoE
VIVLLRHGRTDANARGLLLGRADPALDDLGREQARAAAEVLAETAAVGRVVSSPLARCRATAAIVAGVAGGGLEVEIDERWIELDYGELDGTPLSAVPATTWAEWQGDVGWAPPGGESHADLGERVRAACDELAAPAGHRDVSGTHAAGGAGGDVVVVSHVSPIKAAVAWALGVGDEVAWHLFLAPASITRIAPRGTRHSLQSFNETAHLRHLR